MKKTEIETIFGKSGLRYEFGIREMSMSDIKKIDIYEDTKIPADTIYVFIKMGPSEDVRDFKVSHIGETNRMIYKKPCDYGSDFIMLVNEPIESYRREVVEDISEYYDL